jgi:hypothetical protein
MPSPQSATHGALVNGQAYPVSIWQVAEQPSPGFVLPSSHFSLPSMVPLPHLTVGHVHS